MPAAGLRHERQATLIEGVFAKQPGVLHAAVAFGARRLYVEFDPSKTSRPALLALAHTLQKRVTTGEFTDYADMARCDVPAEPFPKLAIAHDAEPGCAQFGEKSFVVESVVLRMLQDAAPQRMGDEVTEHFLSIEPSARTKNAVNLSNGIPPRRHVVHDPEVEDGVVVIVWGVDPSRVPDAKANAVAVVGEARRCLSDHVGVQVECIHALGAELREDQLHTDASSTANLEGSAAG